jgi:dihydroflavonol-4-reductase
MRAPMRDADIVIHNAGWYELGVSRQARAAMHAINVDGTENVLGLAQELGTGRVLHVSSTVYFGDTGGQVRDESYQRQHPFSSYYEQTKTEAHELALEYAGRGLPVFIVCPAAVMGPNDHAVWGYFLRLYLNGMMPPMAWSPTARNSGVHVEDLAEGIALAAEKGQIGETYILAGDPVTLRDVVKLWMTFPGRFRIRFFVPTWLMATMVAPLEPLMRKLGLPAFLSRETVRAGDMDHGFSSAKAQRELGWHYRPFQEMWREIVSEEIRLLAQRHTRNLAKRLKPLEFVEPVQENRGVVETTER